MSRQPGTPFTRVRASHPISVRQMSRNREHLDSSPEAGARFELSVTRWANRERPAQHIGAHCRRATSLTPPMGRPVEGAVSAVSLAEWHARCAPGPTPICSNSAVTERGITRSTYVPWRSTKWWRRLALRSRKSCLTPAPAPTRKGVKSKAGARRRACIFDRRKECASDGGPRRSRVHDLRLGDGPRGGTRASIPSRSRSAQQGGANGASSDCANPARARLRQPSAGGAVASSVCLSRPVAGRQRVTADDSTGWHKLATLSRPTIRQRSSPTKVSRSKQICPARWR
jgi:hypothetical protein